MLGIARNVVAELIKDGDVIDTYAMDVATSDDLSETAQKAFAYFRDRHPSMVLLSDDVRIEFPRMTAANREG